MAVQFEMEGERAWTELVAVFFARKKNGSGRRPGPCRWPSLRWPLITDFGPSRPFPPPATHRQLHDDDDDDDGDNRPERKTTGTIGP